MYHRLYHRHMPGEDSLSSRFDYLFEPLDEAESADATVVAASSASDSADDGKSSHSAVPVRMAFAAFVLRPQSEPRPTSPSRSPGAAPPTHRPRDRRSAWRSKRASRSRTSDHNKVDRPRVICFPASACPDRYDARARRISSSPRRPRRRCRSRARRSHRAPGLVPTTDRAPPNRPTAVSTCIRTRTVAVSCSANGRDRSFYGHHR